MYFLDTLHVVFTYTIRDGNLWNASFNPRILSVNLFFCSILFVQDCPHVRFLLVDHDLVSVLIDVLLLCTMTGNLLTIIKLSISTSFLHEYPCPLSFFFSVPWFFRTPYDSVTGSYWLQVLDTCLSFLFQSNPIWLFSTPQTQSDFFVTSGSVWKTRSSLSSFQGRLLTKDYHQ